MNVIVWEFGISCSVSFSPPDLFPVPDLITISANKMVITDIDRNQTIQSLSAKGDIKGVCYTANDETMYYSQEDSLFLLNIQNNSRLQVFYCIFPCLKGACKICILLQLFWDQVCHELEPNYSLKTEKRSLTNKSLLMGKTALETWPILL